MKYKNWDEQRNDLDTDSTVCGSAFELFHSNQENSAPPFPRKFRHRETNDCQLFHTRNSTKRYQTYRKQRPLRKLRTRKRDPIYPV